MLVAQERSGVVEQRDSTRRATAIAGRLVWKDARSATRFASVLIRNVSDQGAYVECLSGTPIPLYRLVHLQTEPAARRSDELPACLRSGRVLAAVYRVEPPRAGAGVPQGYGLRLLVEPAALAASRRHGESSRTTSRPGLAVARSIA